jgi:hypothetical protein
MSTQTFVLPPKSAVGYLDPEIAGEGQQVLMSDGEQVNWSPPPVKPVMPDWSGIKAIRKFFGRSGHQTWPAWLYHPTQGDRVVKNAEEAATLGICYRAATIDERGRYGVKAVWDWKDDCLWRPEPHAGKLRFDPSNPGQGKIYQASMPNPTAIQNDLVRALIPEVAAAVAAALKTTGPNAPSTVDPKQWEAFLQFQAWQKTAEAVEAIVEGDVAVNAEEPEETNALAGENALTPDQERTLWEEEAKRKGLKVDSRWSLKKLISVVEDK